MSLLHTIALTFIKGVGPISARMLIAKYKDSENIFKERLDILAKTPKIYNRQNEKYKFSKRKVQKNPFFIKKTVGM